MSARAVSFELNGEPVTVLAEPLETLQSVRAWAAGADRREGRVSPGRLR